MERMVAEADGGRRPRHVHGPGVRSRAAARREAEIGAHGAGRCGRTAACTSATSATARRARGRDRGVLPTTRRPPAGAARSPTSTCARTRAPRTDAWEATVERIERARREGVDVLTDNISMTHGPGRHGRASCRRGCWRTATRSPRERLSDPAIRRRLRTECDRYWRFIHRGRVAPGAADGQPAAPGAGHGLHVPGDRRAPGHGRVGRLLRPAGGRRARTWPSC